MKTAFITGANVGQANLLVKALSQRGWRVFAGVLPGAPTDLRSDGNITVVDQDVSKTESVQKSAEIVTQARLPRNWIAKIFSQLPLSRCSSVSPTQTMGRSFPSSAARTFRLTISSVSPNNVRRSLWPSTT